MDNQVKKMLPVILFFVFCIGGVILTEISLKDYEYGQPFEMSAVVTDKEANKKARKVGKRYGKKNRSSDYEYYVYVELEDKSEVKIKCSGKSEYETYSVGEKIIVIRQELTKKGEFVKMVYSFKE